MKKAVIAVLAAAIFAAAPAPRAHFMARTNEERVAYAGMYGWKVSPNPVEMEHMRLPYEMDDVYKEYNKLQKAAGLDIAPYMGKGVTRYTYEVKNHKKAFGRQVRLNIIVCEGKVAAADIMVVNIDGFMHSISKNEYAF